MDINKTREDFEEFMINMYGDDYDDAQYNTNGMFESYKSRQTEIDILKEQLRNNKINLA